MKISKNKIKLYLTFFSIVLSFIIFIQCAHKDTSSTNTADLNPLENTTITSALILDNNQDMHHDFYLTKIQPLFNSRCVACHACVEAPCTLLLTSNEGLNRGSRLETNSLSQLVEVKPTRLKDTQLISDWRKQGFTEVISSKTSVPALQDNLLYQFIQQAYNYNRISFALNDIQAYSQKQRVCPINAKQFKSLIHEFPGLGMPFGLPAVSKNQMQTIKTWVANGSPGPSALAKMEMVKPSQPESIRQWEEFFNQKGLKNQLLAKYIYEHVFTAHIHFENTPDNEFYTLIRSETPNPDPIRELVTPRPIDPTANAIFYYRFEKVTESIVKKTHILWELKNSEKDKWTDYLDDPEWLAPSLEDFKNSSENPFVRFKTIPAKYRYQFLIDNAYMIVNSMIRGTVCTGKRASFAIRDHFWVMFLKPEVDDSLISLEKEKPWESLSSLQEIKDFIKHKLSIAKEDKVYSVESIWDGDGYNQNAFLTVLRHELSATVHKGLVGGLPNTLWVLNFSNFEKIYYNLVPEFKPWGSAAHQISTFRAMTKHRQEAEERFLMFFQKDERAFLYEQWEEGIFSDSLLFAKDNKTPLAHTAVDKLMTAIKSHIPNNVLFNKLDINLSIDNENEKQQNWDNKINLVLTEHGRKIAKYFPNISYIKLNNEAYTLLPNRYYKFNDLVVGQDFARNPDLDTLILLKGLVGDRPELFFDLNIMNMDLFIQGLQNLNSPSDWIEFKKGFAKHRTDSHFWDLYDWFYQSSLKDEALEAGILDLNHYDLTTW